MTPLMLSKRMVKHLRTVSRNLPHDRTMLPPNHMGIIEYRYAIPSRLLTALGPKVISLFKLRTGFTCSVLRIPAGSGTHKHSYAHDDNLRSWFLVYLSDKSCDLTYWDPRYNREEQIQLQLGQTFVLSTHHKFAIENHHNSEDAVFFAVNTNQSWADCAKHFQHQW